MFSRSCASPRLCVGLAAWVFLGAYAMREAWHFRAIRARNIEDCTRECDEDVKCRAWQYHRITRECRLNEYVEVNRPTVQRAQISLQA